MKKLATNPDQQQERGVYGCAAGQRVDAEVGWDGPVGFCLLSETGSNSCQLRVRIREEGVSGLQRDGVK